MCSLKYTGLRESFVFSLTYKLRFFIWKVLFVDQIRISMLDIMIVIINSVETLKECITIYCISIILYCRCN